MYLVLCSERARLQMFSLMDSFPDQAPEIRSAIHNLYQELMNDPLTWGGSREGAKRLGFERPIWATIRVDTSKNQVLILNIKFAPRRPPKPDAG